MGPILYFKGGSEIAAAFRADDCHIMAGDDKVHFVTTGASKQNVEIAVTDGTSADVVKSLADGLANLTGKQGGAIVIRDTDAGTSFVSGLGAVTVTTADLT